MPSTLDPDVAAYHAAIESDTTTPTSPSRLWELFCIVAAPVLLLGVAAFGAHRFATVDHTAWRTVSFGMFSHVDDEGNRLIVGQVETRAGTTIQSPPAGLRSQVETIAIAPTSERLQQLADDWKALDDDILGVQVVAYRLHYDADRGELTLRQIRFAGVAG